MHQLLVLVCVKRTRKKVFNAISACCVGVIVVALSPSMLFFLWGWRIVRLSVYSLAGKLLKIDIILGGRSEEFDSHLAIDGRLVL